MKALSRKRRKARITLPGGESVPAKPAHARDRRHTNQPQEDARMTVINARAKRLPEGADPLNPMAGCNVGRRIMRETDADRRTRLWGAVCHMRRVYAAYAHALGAPSRYAKCLSILTPTEAMEAADHHIRVDTRSDEDRSRDAIRAWMAVQGWLRYADNGAVSACINAVLDDVAVRDWEGVMIALDCVADGMAGLVPEHRGRAA